MRHLNTLLLGLCLGAQALAAPDPGKDPMPSVMWDFHHQRILDGAPYVFDDRVQLLAPPFAEDARQVPIQVDARALPLALFPNGMALRTLHGAPAPEAGTPFGVPPGVVAFHANYVVGASQKRAWLESLGLWFD